MYTKGFRLTTGGYGRGARIVTYVHHISAQASFLSRCPSGRSIRVDAEEGA